MSDQPKTTATPQLSISDILPDYGSYLYDLDSTMNFDSLSQKKQAAILKDVLMDYGTFPAGMSPKAVEDAAKSAARKYVGI